MCLCAPLMLCCDAVDARRGVTRHDGMTGFQICEKLPETRRAGVKMTLPNDYERDLAIGLLEIGQTSFVVNEDCK